MSTQIEPVYDFLLPQATSGVSPRDFAPSALGLRCGCAMLLTIVAALANHSTTLIAMALFVIAIVVAAMRNMTAAIALVITYSSLEGLFKYLNNWSMLVYAVKPVVVIVLFIIWRLRTIKRRQGYSLKPPLTGLLFLLSIWSVIEVLNPKGLGFIQSALTLWMWYLAPLLFFFLTYDSVVRSLKSRDGKNSSRQIIEKAEALCYAGAIIGAIVAGFALFQFVMGIDWTEAHLPGYAALRHPGWFIINSRGLTLESSFFPASTTDLGGAGAEWASLGSMLTLGLLFSPRVPLKHKVFLAACYFVDIAGNWVSGVRLFVILTIIQIPIFAILAANSINAFRRNTCLVLVIMAIIAIAVLIGQTVSKGIMLDRYATTLINPVGSFQHDRGGNLTYLPRELDTFPLGIGYHRGASDFAHREDQKGSIMGVGDLGFNRETQFNAIADDMGVPGVVFLALIFGTALYLGLIRTKSFQDAHQRAIAASLFVLFGGYVVACSLAGPLLQAREYVWVFLALLFSLRSVSQFGNQSQALASTASGGTEPHHSMEVNLAG